MRYLRNAWYVAAWAHELKPDELFSRQLFGKAIVMFRRHDGTPAALDDRCPHRFAPLSKGRLTANSIECGYHGLRFDGSGACVHNPHGSGVIPRACRVPAYPLQERHGILWIWPGNPELANADLIPDFGYLIASDRKTIFGMAQVQADYELIIDNLMDASHTQYVHQDLLGTDAFARSKHEVIHEEQAVHSNYLIPNSEVPEAYKEYFPADPSLRVDYSVNFRWIPPALVRNSVSLLPVGESKVDGVLRTGTHLMTPAAERSTHYFFAHTRNFQLDDEKVDERIRWWQKAGLTDQDGAMIEAAQRVMGTDDFESLSPVLLSIDIAAVRVRRVLGQLIAKEQELANSP
jgi:vanillate O-demethylase monooxygenase subunit